MAGASKVKAKKTKKTKKTAKKTAKKAPAKKPAPARKQAAPARKPPAAPAKKQAAAGDDAQRKQLVALRKEFVALKGAAAESDRNLKAFVPVAQALGAPKGNGVALKNLALKLRKEAAEAVQLRKQLEGLKKQSKADLAKWLAELGKAKKATASAAADGLKHQAKVKALGSALGEREQKLKALSALAKQGAASAKQVAGLQKSVETLTRQQAATVEKQKQADLKAAEKVKQLDDASTAIKAQLAEKTKLAKDGARSVIQNQKLNAAIITAKETHKKLAEQCKAAEQRAKEAEKKVVALEKQVVQLTPKAPVIRPGALMQLKQVDTKIVPPAKPLIDQAKAKIKQAEERIKAAPKPPPAPRPKPTVVEDEIPFDEEDGFEEEEEEEEEEEAAEPAADEPSGPAEPVEDDEEEPPREE